MDTRTRRLFLGLEELVSVGSIALAGILPPEYEAKPVPKHLTISRRSFLGAATGASAAAYATLYQPFVAAETSFDQKDLEEAVGQNVRLKSVEPIYIGPRYDGKPTKPAYMCELAHNVKRKTLSLSEVITNHAIYFIRNGMIRRLESVAEVLANRNNPRLNKDPEILLVLREYEGKPFSKEDFVSYNFNLENKDALIWTLIEHVKQHDYDLSSGKMDGGFGCGWGPRYYQMKQETGFPINSTVLAEERGLIAGLLRCKKEYYWLSEVFALQKLPKKEYYLRTAGTVLIQLFDRRMQEIGIPANQYTSLSRQQITDVAVGFAQKYFPDLVENK